MTSTEPVSVVHHFYDRLNARDVQAVLALASDDIRIGGPRGVGVGKHLLEEWVARANVTITVWRWFQRDDIVAVEHETVWHSRFTGEDMGRMVGASVFTVDNGKITGLARYGFLGEAVNSASMDESNQVDSPG